MSHAASGPGQGAHAGGGQPATAIMLNNDGERVSATTKTFSGDSCRCELFHEGIFRIGFRIT